MTRPAEARFWQVVGLLVGMAGGVILIYATVKFGLASINPSALSMGLTASFLILSGAAAFLCGRSLHVKETKLTPGEARLWAVLAIICLVSGGVVVGFTFNLHKLLVLDRLAMGLAGAFAVMMGVICLLGQRVMSRMHDLIGTEESQEHSHVVSA